MTAAGPFLHHPDGLGALGPFVLAVAVVGLAVAVVLHIIDAVRRALARQRRGRGETT